MPKINVFYQFYMFLPLEVNITSNSLHSSYSLFTCSQDNHFAITMTSIQYWVSLSSTLAHFSSI
jgi:hypothetical protein